MKHLACLIILITLLFPAAIGQQVKSGSIKPGSNGNRPRSYSSSNEKKNVVSSQQPEEKKAQVTIPTGNQAAFKKPLTKEPLTVQYCDSVIKTIETKQQWLVAHPTRNMPVESSKLYLLMLQRKQQMTLRRDSLIKAGF